jgi:hypothetical protein
MLYVRRKFFNTEPLNKLRRLKAAMFTELQIIDVTRN